MNYFIIINGVQQGPFTVAELQERHIASDTLVWAEGMAQWTPAWQVDELKTLFYQQQATVAPPPPPFNVGEQTTPQYGHEAVTPQPARKPSHRGWWLAAGLLFVLLLFMAIKNPPKSKHQEVIKEHVAGGITKALTNGNGGFLGQNMDVLARMFVGPVVDGVLDEMLVYHNYLLFSTTTIELHGNREKTTSYGFLGQVFTANEQEIADAISSKMMKATGLGSTDYSSLSGTGAQPEDAMPDEGQDMQKQPDGATTDTLTLSKKMSRAIIDHVGAAIKKQLVENTDSATSSGVGKLVDDIIGLLK